MDTQIVNGKVQVTTPIVETYTLGDLLAQQVLFTKQMANMQARLDNVNALIQTATAGGLKTQEELKATPAQKP